MGGGGNLAFSSGGMKGCGGGPRLAKRDGMGRLGFLVVGGGGGEKVDVGRRGTLRGVADNISNLGGSAENGRNELGPGTAGVTSNDGRKVELNIGSGVLTVTSASGKIFLMVDGDTL